MLSFSGTVGLDFIYLHGKVFLGTLFGLANGCYISPLFCVGDLSSCSRKSINQSIWCV